MIKGQLAIERYLVEFTGDQLDRLNGMVREAINADEDESKREETSQLSGNGCRCHAAESGGGSGESPRMKSA
jgi:hypothetical protein